MGCLRRLGCLILLLILACAAWLTRGLWLPEQFRPHLTSPTTVGWEPATNAGATRAESAIARLGQAGGPNSVTISAGDFVSLIRRELGARIEGKVDSLTASAHGDRFSIRGRANLSRLGGAAGTAGIFLSDGEPVALSGKFNILEPGLAEFQILEATVARVTLPSALIPRMVREIDRGGRPAKVHVDALPLPMPTSVSDIRVENGKITLHKNAK